MIYLFIKQHTVTGLKYFGFTKKQDPIKYPGSGTHWSNHYKKYGKEHIITIGLWMFYDQEECTEFALKFSEENNIVESLDWANKIPETGFNSGCPKGFIPWNKNKKGLYRHTIEAKAKISASSKGRISINKGKASIRKGKTYKEIYGVKRAEEISLSKIGKICSLETRAKISASKKGKTYEEIYGIESAAEIKRKNSAIKTGKILSEDTKAKMSIAKKNMSLETKIKMSETHKGKILSKETKKKMSESHKKRGL